MNRGEQNIYLSAEHTEAGRYMDNAEEALKKATKMDDKYYLDKKYVKTACGVAYSGVLVAIDAWIAIKGAPEPAKKKHKSIDYYMFNLSKLDKKMAALMDTAYDVLHLAGYYRGERRIKVIEEGFVAAYEIIEKIKPEKPVETTETMGNKAKRLWNNMLIFAAAMLK
jgi:hypothetical protein